MAHRTMVATDVNLTAARVAGFLDTLRYGRSIDVRETTASTNDDAHAAAARGAPDGHVVLANHQENGRGAHGRAWSSPAGTDLYFSVVSRLEIAASRAPMLSLATGVAVAEATEGFLGGTRVELKWPNDLWIDDQKCGGILVETRTTCDRVEIAI